MSFRLLALALVPAATQAQADADWVVVTEDDRAMQVETDTLEAVIPNRSPKPWMTGIEKGMFLDKTTRFREVGDGLMVIDWLMEADNDEARSDQISAARWRRRRPLFRGRERERPHRRSDSGMAHGTSHRKRIVEGPQLCHRMKPVEPSSVTISSSSHVSPRWQAMDRKHRCRCSGRSNVETMTASGKEVMELRFPGEVRIANCEGSRTRAARIDRLRGDLSTTVADSRTKGPVFAAGLQQNTPYHGT